MDIDLDCEFLHFDINEEILLDDLESFYMIDTPSLSYKEKSIGTN